MVNEPQVMLAPNVEVAFGSDKIKFPLLGSAKLDGMRLKITPEGVFSRTHKKQSPAHQMKFAPLVRKAQAQNIILDGELWSDRLPFNEIMQRDNLWVCELHIFDMMSVGEWYAGGERPFIDRVDEYQQWIKRHCSMLMIVHAVDQVLIRNARELEELYDRCIQNGLEGCVTRPVLSKYKHGRATLNEGLMFKWKKWVTVDGRIVGFKFSTMMAENVPREIDELGHPKAVHSQQHRVQLRSIGSMEIELDDGTRFFAGACRDSKFTGPATEDEFKTRFLGKMVEVRYQETGTKDKPRMPAITRWRPDKDIIPVRVDTLKGASFRFDRNTTGATLEDAVMPPIDFFTRMTGRPRRS